MSDDVKEKKLAAARLKLRKYQIKKEEKVKLSVSRESTPDNDEHLISIRKSEMSSQSSSVADVYEAVKKEINSDLKSTEQDASSLAINSPKLMNIEYQNLQCDLPISGNGVYLNKFSEVYQQDKDITITNVLESDPSMVDDNDGSVSTETNISLSTVIPADGHQYLLPVNSEGPAKSTSESLRQLSLQLRGLVNDGDEIEPSGPQFAILELENRNVELAALLSKEKQMNMQQTQLVEELRTRLSTQDSQIQTLQSMAMTANNNVEVVGLREQLQVHIQTIGILVAEKSDLQSSLANTRHSLEQRSGEVTDLQGRLEASRHRVRDLQSTVQKLEIELSSISASKENDSQQLASLQSSNSVLNKMCEELRSSVAELSERLTLKSEENMRLSSDVDKLRRDLDLAQIHIRQLNTESQEDLHVQLQNLQLAYQESQKQVLLAKETAEKVLNERMQLEGQYKAYVNELSTEKEILKEKLASAQQSQQDLELSKSELEEKLKVEEAKSFQMTSRLTVSDFEEEKSSLLKTIEKYQEDYLLLEEKCASLVSDNGHLSQLLSEQNSQLEVMENAAERNSFNKVDTSQLLQTMQSDKIAASRALTQNKLLKEQLEELQNGFIMMSNKKLELTEKLEKELHIKKALHQEVAQLSEEITSQKEELLRKKREIEKLTDCLQSQNSYAMNSGKYSSEGRIERTSLNGHSTAKKDTILTPGHHEQVECKFKPSNNRLDQKDTNDSEHSLQPNNEAHLQNGFTKSGCEGGSPQEEAQSSRENSLQWAGNGLDSPPCLHDVADVNKFSEFAEVSLRTAHEALEKRFSRCMDDLVIISDEKQRLEHLVQQLQIETETVGDYITIYQFQRGVMKQQMQEMKSELELMKVEKEETMSRFSKLQDLFSSLATEDATHEGVLSGIKNIIETASTVKEPQFPSESEDESDSQRKEGDSLKDSSGAQRSTPKLKQNKKETVKEIINLISEMETSSQLDFTALHKFHPCSHCSGRLITI